MRYPVFKFCVFLCLSLSAVRCAASPNTAPASAPESSVQTEPTAELSTASSQIANASAPSSVEALWVQLMEADEKTYVVLLRHAMAKPFRRKIAPGTGEPANFQLNDCSTQRNLSEAGRQQAMEIGEAFRDRNIPVTKVLSSQWCRCLETAELMDIAPVEPFLPLNSFFRDRSTAESQTAQVKDYVAETEAASGVIVMVTHQVNITALSDVVPQSGSAVVMQLNDGRLEVLGQLLEDDS